MINVDKEGFLRDLNSWSEDVAKSLASQDDIELSSSHWQILNLVRTYYDDYQISPQMRVLVKLVREEFGPEQGSSIYLMRLFGGKPAKTISKIAGLPKPSNCD